MAAAKRRFPYSAREADGRTYAELPNGRELVFTGPAGARAQARARAQDVAGAPYAPVQPPGYDPNFDALAYQRAVEASSAPLPAGVRGSVRDMAPTDDPAAVPFTRAPELAPGESYDLVGGPDAVERGDRGATGKQNIPMLAESQENQRAIDGPMQTGGDPAAPLEERLPQLPAALPGARLKGGPDVQFYEERPTYEI